MTSLLLAALWSAAATLAARSLSGRWRSADVALWHHVWVSIAGASLMLSVALALPIEPLVVVPVGTTLAESRSALPGRTLDVVGGIYAIGVAFFGLQFLSGLMLVGRLRRRSTPVDAGLFPWIRVRHPDRATRIHTHPRVQVPMATGWRRPVVILPESWLVAEPARLLAVIDHELAHVARRDYAWNVLGALFRVVFWFSPAAWTVVRHIRLTSELAADRAASCTLGRLTYARILLESAREFSHVPQAGMLAPSAAEAFSARIEALTADDDLPAPAGARFRRTVAGTVAMLIVAGAFVGFVASAAPTTPPPGDHDAIHAERHAGH